MAEKNNRIIVLLILLSFVSVLPYLQFVVPGTTQAESSQIHTSGGTYNYWPNRTVDGNTSQKIKACLHTADTSTIELAWLRIDLDEVKSIKYVKFWYRNDRGGNSINTERLRGYSIRVSNTSDIPTNSTIQVCYTDPGKTTLKTLIENNCNRTAQYVWFYQTHKTGIDGAILEICEVKIFGCNTGFYGQNCSHDCSHCMNADSCNIDTGACDELGCALRGYQPPLCQECRPVNHGDKCSLDCSEFCIEGRCNSSNGKCILGCKPGYQGPHCNQTCPSSYFGNDCKESCGHCFENVTCNHVNGTCEAGCGKGFKGELCNTPCNGGEYGVECKYNCSGHCFGGSDCDRYDGYCDLCTDGYQGPKCNEKCDKGTYGRNCSSECGNCLNTETCHHISGSCPRGCEPGWQATDTCLTPCSNGSFGMDCVYNCSGTCANNEICDKKDGKCQQCAAGWENPYCNKSLKKSSTSTEVAAIAAPLVVVIVLVALIVAVITLRRKYTPEKDEHVQMQEVKEQVDEEVELAGVQPPRVDNVYYNTSQICSKNIKIGELRNVIKSLEDEDGENNFEKEFRGIPYGEQAGIPCTVGKLANNIPKNRFKTTFPYDHSRVVLSSTQNGDYINASFIKDTSGETAYIASQGPKLNTVREFWQMIWEENVFVIAMVTNTSEGATIKCERYWPESVGSKVTKGNFIIHLTSEKNYATFSIHKLRVVNNEMKKSRQITHLQYTAWPDHGTPSPLELLVFYRYVVRAREKHPENKLVVHCSAGIGRTGTFIALDALYKQGTREGRINIVEYVRSMREDRMNMVQNANQYRFLYYVLHEAFQSQGHMLNKMDFVKEVESEISSTKAVNLSKFMKEFNELTSIKSVFEEKDTKFGKQNIHLNMTKTILPADKIRIILTSHVPGRGTYYNAVPISTFTMKDSIIAAQYPVPGAAVDLIRLLVDHECSTLLSTDLLSDIPSSAEWFSPLNGSQEIMNYKIEIDSTSQPTKHILKSIMSAKAPSENDWHKITVYEFATWRSTDILPPDPSAILDSIKCIQQNENVDIEHKVCVLSRDGATGCGVFCAVYNAIQQLQQDGEVDMFTIVRQLQSRRPEMISDFSEYMFCCQTVLQYLTSGVQPEDVYVNPQPENDDSVYANV